MTAAEMDRLLAHMRRIWGGRLAGDEATEVAKAYATVLMRHGYEDAFRAVLHLSETATALPKPAQILELIRGYVADRELRASADVLKLPAPAEDRMSLEAFVASMHVDRRRQHTEINDLVRRGLMSPAVAERNHTQIESVGPAEIAAYRDVAAGGWKSRATSMSLLMERASHAGESYPEVAAFLAHENAEAVADVVPEQSGRDKAVTPDPDDDESVETRAQELIALMAAGEGRSIDWTSVPAAVKDRCRLIAQERKGVKA